MATKRRSSSGWIFLLLLLGGLGYGAWWYFQKKPEGQGISYKTTVPSRGDITQVVTANGQISPIKNVSVGSQVSGIITDIRADFNSQVTNGQVIAQIDPSTYEQVITQMEAEISSVEASLELARLTQKRSIGLRDQQVIAAAELDKSTAELRQMEASLKIKQAQLRKARLDLERTTIYAPIDGMVISRVVDVGQTVAASFNAPTLFTIANDLRRMRIEAMVSEADVGGVKEQQRVNFTVDAFPERTFRGEVTQVRFAPITNQNVVNYTTIVEVDNSDLRLRPGMTANASIVIAQKKDVLRIPNAATRFRPPESTDVKGGTNKTNAGSGSKSDGSPQVTGVGSGGDGGGSSKTPPTIAASATRESGGGGGGSGGSVDREEMRKRMESMSPEEREQMRARWRSGRGGEGGGGGGGGSGRGGRGGRDGDTGGPVTRTVYVLTKDLADGKEKDALKPVTVKLGISDGTMTEVLEGLSETDQVVTGTNLPAQPAAANAARPGGSPFGGSPFGGGGGGMRPR